MADIVEIDLSGIDPRTNPNSPDFDPEYFKAYSAAWQEKAPELYSLVKGRLFDIMKGLFTDPEDSPAADPERREEYERQLAEIRQAIREAADAAAPAIYETVVNEIETAPQQLSLDGFQTAEIEFESAIDRALETEKAREQIVMALQSINQPTEIVRPTPRLLNMFFSNQIPADGQFYPVRSGPKIPTGKGKSETIAPDVAYSLLNLPPNISISRDLAPFDDIVHTAVTSLYEAGNRVLTPDSIYRTFTGDVHSLATEDTRNMIEESLLRMMTAWMDIKPTVSMDIAYNMRLTRLTGPVIQAERIEVEVRNQFGTHKVPTYVIDKQPLLYRYANALNQIKRFPPMEFNTPVNKTTDIIILQSAILDHIHAIPKESRYIVYDNLFSSCGTFDGLTPESAKRKKNTLRQHIHKMLDYWTKQGIIPGWEETRQGRTVRGIKILTEKEAKEAANRGKT